MTDSAATERNGGGSAGTAAEAVSPESGLAEADVRARLTEYGYNEIQPEQSGLLRGILKRLWGPIPWLLEIALILEVFLGKVAEPFMIAALLVFSAILGGVQERSAHDALDLLRSRLQINARVRRAGAWRIVPARELVPGDRIRLRTGDVVPADCTVADGMLEVDQSALTGESAVVERSKGGAVYSASTVRRGDAAAVVTATGTHTYFGKAAELVRTAHSAGHLEQLLFSVVRYLIMVDAVLAVVLAGAVIWSGEALFPLIPFFLVLVTVTVPVTMPAAFTASNAVEARTLAKQGVLVTGLSAVQEAATMDVLCVDKTGTLTQNRESVAAVVSFSGESEGDILAWAAAACDASDQSPLDVAILQAMKDRSVSALRRLKFIPFDPAAKRSEAFVEHEGQTLHVVLGSPSVVQQLAAPQSDLVKHVEALAASGARVLAVAAGPEGHLAIRGLVSLADEPREDAASLVKALQALGIRVLMVTGDTLATARAIAQKVGLGDRFGDVAAALKDPLQYDGFANFYPEDKFRLVKALQRTGEVGMTGDGVNDAPALKQAEVGIAVSTASDVAKASAQVVMTRPGLQDIVAVVLGGRRVYRRMLTWTVAKISRTFELAALLTVGYIATGFFVVPLFLIVVIVVLNDLVTITLATDRASITPVPERWNVAEIAKVGGVLAIGWLMLGLSVLWVALAWLKLSMREVQTLMFVYLMYSAQATIYLTRVRGRLWSFAPSKWVAVATIGNVIIASVLAIWGVLTAPVSIVLLAAMLGAVLVAAVLLDQIKVWLFQDAEQLRDAGAPVRS